MIAGTRDSKLAMRQTEIFVEKMKNLHPEVPVEVVSMKALGDKDLKSPLSQITEIGAFVRELDEALLAGRIDITVNSLKDIPIDMDPGLTIAAMFTRDATEDVMIPCSIDDLPAGAVVGTSSTRRRAFLREYRPDIVTKQLRGNIHTRLSKLDAGEYDAIILAKAGLDRMGIERPMAVMDPEKYVPAPAQGVIAVECRKDDVKTIAMLSGLDDAETRRAVEAERRIMKIMGAGCSSPVGINVRRDGEGFRIRAVAYDADGKPRKADMALPFDYDDAVLAGIADYLAGKKETI